MTMNSQCIFAHTWTIENAGHLFYDALIAKNKTLSCIRSGLFSAPIQSASEGSALNPWQFYLQFFPNGIDNERTKDRMSLYLHLQSGPDVKVDCAFSIMDFQDLKQNSKDASGILSKYNNCIGIENYVQRSDLTSLTKGLCTGNLVIYCEIGLHTENLNCQQTPVWLISPISTTNAKVDVHKIPFQCVFPQIRQIRQTKTHLESDKFPLNKLKGSNIDVEFILRLLPELPQINGICGQIAAVPNGTDEEHLSMELKPSKCNKVGIMAHSCLSILDLNNRKFNSRWMHAQIVEKSAFLWERYICFAELFKSESGLIRTNDELHVQCDIEIYFEVMQQNKSPNWMPQQFANQWIPAANSVEMYSNCIIAKDHSRFVQTGSNSFTCS